MAKVYYTVDTSSANWPVRWINEKNQLQETVLPHAGAYDPGAISQEFQKFHPGAIWMKLTDFWKRWAFLSLEQERLQAWNSWASGNKPTKEEEWPWPMPESPYDPDPRDFGGRI